MKNLKEKLRKKDKLVFGRNQVLKLCRSGKIEEVIIASNSIHKKEFNDLKKINKILVSEVKETNEELGALCKKPFTISILGIKK